MFALSLAAKEQIWILILWEQVLFVLRTLFVHCYSKGRSNRGFV
jgi:hypothetical protein